MAVGGVKVLEGGTVASDWVAVSGSAISAACESSHEWDICPVKSDGPESETLIMAKIHGWIGSRKEW